MPNNLDSILLIGAGKMSQAYAKALTAQDIPFNVVGRSQSRLEEYKTNFPGVKATSGGIENYLQTEPAPSRAIVATNITNMVPIAKLLVENGIESILLEKPGGLDADSMIELRDLAQKANAKIYVAYNRRFYASINGAKRMIEEDGGITSMHFEFTEMVHKIKMAKHGEVAMAKWVLSNSTHVIDTSFFLAGFPRDLSVHVSGNSVAWHPSGSIFTGMGTTEMNVPFTYHANWGSAGRWSIELMTTKRRFMLSPMERLQIQNIGDMTMTEVELDYSLDKDFKPGIYGQSAAFFADNSDNLLSLSEHIDHLKIYNQIAGY